MENKGEFDLKYVSLYHNDDYGIDYSLRIRNNIQYLLDTDYNKGYGDTNVRQFTNDVAIYILKCFRKDMDYAIERQCEWKKESWFLMDKNREHFNANLRDEIGGDNDDFFHLFYYGIQDTEIKYNIAQLKKNFIFDYRLDRTMWRLSQFEDEIDDLKYNNSVEEMTKTDVDLACMFYCLEHCKASDFKVIREIRNRRDIMNVFSQIVLRNVKYKMVVTNGL